jgi:glycosyltransferase involved in cell wall biosynthesis
VKILFVLHTLTSGGAERVTSVLAKHWVADGHDVTIATMGAGEDFYVLDPRVKRRRHDLSHPTGSAWQAAAAARRRIAALRALLIDEEPDVAIGMMTSWSVELALAARGLPVTTIGSERIHPPTIRLGRAWELLRRYGYGLLNHVVAQTEPSRRWIEAHTRARDVRVIANPCAEPTDEHPAVLAGLPQHAPVILGVGRLVPQKRFDLLIEALASDQDALEEWHLVLVGEGPLQAELEQRVAAAGLTGRVHFPGRTPAIGGWYRRADIFALSSDFEGYPNALLEAMARGLAVVATDCETGPADLVEDGVNGLLVPPGDQRALAEALVRLAGDRDLRARLGRAALAVGAAHAPQAIAKKWEALFPVAAAR